jgi:hypothetical protein
MRTESRKGQGRFHNYLRPFGDKRLISRLTARFTLASRLVPALLDPLLAGQMSADYIRAVPTIDLPADELAAVTAAIRGVIEGDRYPHAPRLDPLRAALASFDAAAPEPTPDPKAAAKADKRARVSRVS